MSDLRALDVKIRAWLKHLPLQAIVVLLEAIHDELKRRVCVKRAVVNSLARGEDREVAVREMTPYRDREGAVARPSAAPVH